MACPLAFLGTAFLAAVGADLQTTTSLELPASGIRSILHEFDSFSTDFGKNYMPEERAARLSAFEANVQFIHAENAKGNLFELALNSDADLSHADFLATRLGLTRTNNTRPWGNLPHLGAMATIGAALPVSVDWRKLGALTPVHQQGTCGACWTFSATGALSAAWEIQTGVLVTLSQQQLMDCTGRGTEGCQGGNMDAVFAYASGADLCDAASYPYRAQRGTCKAADSCSVGIPRGSVVGYHDVPRGDARALLEAVAQQPVSVGIEAESMAFRFYKAGVFSHSCGVGPNHGVLLVGYGVERGTPYFLLKNSWGSDWGEGGYFKLLRTASGPGECGIMTLASYPVVRAKQLPSTSPPPLTTSTSPPPLTTSSDVAPPGGRYLYGQPPCLEGEVVGHVLGGAVCTPRCSFWGECPSGAAPGVAAKPRCVLKDRSTWGQIIGKKYCALVCYSSTDCGQGAKCLGSGSSGVCVYLDDSAATMAGAANATLAQSEDPRRLAVKELAAPTILL